MKVLITGGCGFLGTNLACHAITRGDELVVFDNLCRQGSGRNLEWLKHLGPFTFVHGDIRNVNDVNRLVKDFLPEAIFHLAGQVAMTTSIANPRLDFEVNAMGSVHLLEAVRLHSPASVVVYSSSNKVYGDLEQYAYRETETRYECIDKPKGCDESTPLNFHSPYGCSKGAADQYMLDYGRIYGLKTVVLRHSSIYGGRQFATYDQGWIGWFCQQAIAAKGKLLNQPFTISGNGKQVRDVLHSEDAIRLYFGVLDGIGGVAGQAFNIGGGIENSLSLLELFALLEDLCGVKLIWEHLPPRSSDQRFFVADLTKVTRMLGWKPEVGARKGILLMLEWLEKGT